MSNPPNNYNTDTNFNKFKGTYFNDDVDVSGGDIINRTGNLYLASDSSIYTPSNQIQFNEEFQFCDFINNVNVLGQLKNTYNSIEYDVGLQCEKTDNLIDDVATLSPIASDTAFKCTNFYYDQASNSTVWSGLLTCPISSIASTAIANTTRFIEGTGNQNVGGIKRFTSNIRIDAGMQLSAGTVTLTNAQLQAIPDISTLKTITTSISYTPATVTTVISNVLQFTGTLNGWSTTNFSNAINYAKDFTSSGQTQINTLITNSVSLSASNVFTGATNQFTNNIRLDGSLIVNNNGTTLTNDNLNRIQYLSGVSSSVSTSITNINTSITSINTSISTLNTKTTKISYMSVGGINTTTILDGLISQVLSFTTSINNITTTTFAYLSGVTSSIQTQLNNLAGQANPTGSIIMSPLSNIATSTSNKYLLCNGQNVSRTTYSILFTAIGTTFGVGDGSTTFTLPNYQGLFFRGMGSQIINSTTYTGVAVNNAQQDAVQNHTHLPQSGSYLLNTSSASATGGYGSQFPATKPDTSNFANTGLMATGRIDTNETRPVNVGIYYYIKS